jgi:hypothetical protein
VFHNQYVPATLPPRPVEASSSKTSQKRPLPFDNNHELASLEKKLRRLESQHDCALALSLDLQIERNSLRKENDSLKLATSKPSIALHKQEQDDGIELETLYRIRAMLPADEESPQSVVGMFVPLFMICVFADSICL